MTSAVLYGTTSDNELRPVQVTDSGEFVTDGGGVRDWYENFYVGGSEGAPSISLLSDGSITTNSTAVFGSHVEAVGSVRSDQRVDANFRGAIGDDDATFISFKGDGATAGITLYAKGKAVFVDDIYCQTLHQSVGYDLQKIGMALSSIHDVLDSVDDLQGLKNLFHLLLDNLKSDPTSPAPEPQGLPEPTEPSE